MKTLILLTFIFLTARVYSQSTVTDFTFDVDYSNCDLVQAQFYFDGNPSSDLDSCIWYFGDGVKKFSSSSNNASYKYSKPGVYSVELVVWKDSVMSSIKKDSIITVYEAPVPSFRYEPSDTSLFAPLTVDFFNTTQIVDGDSLSYTWEINLKDTLSGENTSIEFTDPGTYYVTLKIDSKQGCEKSYTDYIVVRDSAQQGEFPLNMSGCFGETETSPCGYERNFEIISDTLVISGFYYGNCGTTKTVTTNFSGDTVMVKIWETGEHTTCGCGSCFEIRVPDIYTDSVLVNFNGELKTALITGIQGKEIDINSFEIFPNPANDVINISFSNANNECFKYSIIDMQGNVKQSGNLIQGKNTIQLNRQKLSNGFYLLVIDKNDYRKYIGKLLIN